MAVEPVVEQRAHGGGALGLVLGQVVRLARVGREIVVGAEAPVQVAEQLLVAPHDHAPILDLGEGGRQARRGGGRRREPGAEIGSAHARRHRDVEQVEHGRRDVDELHLAADDAGATPGTEMMSGTRSCSSYSVEPW